MEIPSLKNNPASTENKIKLARAEMPQQPIRHFRIVRKSP
jgi:hypothetical protein